MKALGAECHITGDTVRAVVAESQQDAAIDALRRERIRLISLTPVRTSLEDYFVEKLQRSATSAGTTTGVGGMNARILHIARNTFREAVRDRVLYNLIAFALLLSGAAILVGPDFHRHRAPGGRQSRPDRGFAVRRGDRHLHRHRAGLERD